MKHHFSVKGGIIKDTALFFQNDFKIKKYKSSNFNIKGLKIAKSLINFEDWDLNNKNENILNMKKGIDKIKENKNNIKLKNTLKKEILKEDKILRINCSNTNNYSFDFEIFSNNKQNNKNSIYKSKDKLKTNLNLIPHPNPFNKQNINIKTLNKSKINEINHNNIKTESSIYDKTNYLDFIDKDNIYYLHCYYDIINERKNYELKMHSIIKDLTNHLNEVKNNLNNLYNQETRNNSNNKDNIVNNISNLRRKSAASALFGFTHKKEVKQKIIKKNQKLNILNYQLTNNISIFNCKGIFNNIPNINVIKQDNLLFNRQEIKRNEKELEKTEKLLLKCIKSLTNYYLNILSKSIDIREEGLLWVVKRLLRLNYTPKINEFPEYIDENIYSYIITLSKKKNELYDYINEFEQLKNELLSETEFISLKNKINKIDDNYININDLINNNSKLSNNFPYFSNEKNYNNKPNQRYFSEDSKNTRKEEEKIYNKQINNKLSYLDNKYEQYIDNLLFHKLPEEIQILLYFININKNFKRNIVKKNIHKDKNRRSLSFQNNNMTKIQIKNNNKNLLQNKSEIYSNKIKLKNRFIKLNEEEKWNKELKINRKSVGNIIKQKNKKDNSKKYMDLLNMSPDTYKKIEKFILLQIKIKDINLNIKKEIADIKKYLETKKNIKSFDNIYKFIFGNKIK